jgi:hypothetical protein
VENLEEENQNYGAWKDGQLRHLIMESQNKERTLNENGKMNCYGVCEWRTYKKGEPKNEE